MNTRLLKVLFEDTIPGTGEKPEPTKKTDAPKKVQGNLLKLVQVAKEAGLSISDPNRLTTALNNVRNGVKLTTTDNMVLADLLAQMIRMEDDTKLLTIFNKVLKNVEVAKK